MKDLKEFDISFVGLKEGEHHFDYVIDSKFFDFYEYDEFNDSNFKVVLLFLKKATLFELNFKFSGWVEVPAIQQHLSHPSFCNHSPDGH